MRLTIIGIVAGVMVLLALAFAKDLAITDAATFEDGSYSVQFNATWPLSTAWRD